MDNMEEKIWAAVFAAKVAKWNLADLDTSEATRLLDSAEAEANLAIELYRGEHFDSEPEYFECDEGWYENEI